MENTTKTEYPALLASLRPTQAVNVLNNRVKQIHKINSDVSEWLAERRRIEEAYVQSLNRLAARRQEAGFELGVFQTPWNSIIAGTVALAEAHSGFAGRIESDVEKPLRDQRRDLQSMNSMQANLAAMAKELEKAQKKQVSGTESSASQWESQAPYVFEQLQSLDENRVNQMREALTQLQTHEIDCHERSKSSAEAALNALLNVDTPEEVSTFIARTSAELPLATTTAGQSRPATSGHRVPASRTEREMSMSSAGGLAPPTPRQRESDDRRSEISDIAEQTPQTEKKSRFSGLKRLGTVMSRRGKDKDKDISTSRSPERQRPRRTPLRRNSSAVMQPIPSPNASTSNLQAFSASRSPPAREDLLVPASAEPATNGHAEPDTAEATSELQREPQREQQPPMNGTLSPVTNIPTIGVRPPSTIVEEGPASSVLADIERAQQEANAQEPESAFKLNIREKPIQEEDTGAQQAAMANVSNQLRASVVPPPQRRTGTLRGRRDVRNTMFVPNPSENMLSHFSQEPLPGVGNSPVLNNTASPMVGSATENRSADTQSIRSAHSLASSADAGAIKHPEMHSHGLNASIVETASATFTNGAIAKAAVIGEMALVHNGAAPSTASPPSIRLDNFPVLEKVAPNPAFVSQLPGRSGEYNLDLSQLARTSVAFKYQIHLDETRLGSYAPFLINPQFRVEPTQTSVIVTYTLNPAFAPPVGLTTGSPVTVSNVVLILNLEGSRATSCQSKPAGVFSKEKSLIYWKLGEVTLSPDGSAQQRKLLARFATPEGEAKGGSVEARWEIRGVGSGLGVSVLNEGAVGGGAADPFADAGASSTSLVGAREVETVRKLVGGRYIVT